MFHLSYVMVDRSLSTFHCQLDTSPDISERPEKRLVPELSRYEARGRRGRRRRHEEIRCCFEQKKWICLIFVHEMNHESNILVEQDDFDSSELGFHQNVDFMMNFDGDFSMKPLDFSMKKKDFTSQPIEHH